MAEILTILISRQIGAICILLLMVLATSGVKADEIPEPYALYAQGDYEAAISAGEALGTAEGLASAAFAAISDADLRTPPCLSCVDRAQSLAKRAIALNSNLSEPYVVLALSYGLKTHIIGIIRAQGAHYGEQSKKALERALLLKSDSALALAGMGAWHLEITRLLGSFFARNFYGAKADTGKDYFRRAIKSEPENLIVKYQFVLCLSSYDLKDNRKEIESTLQDVAATSARTAYETALRARSAQLFELLARNDDKAYRKLVDRYQGYP